MYNADTSFVSNVSNMNTAITLSVFLIIVLDLMLLVRITKMPVIAVIVKGARLLLSIFYKRINKAEERYKREVEIGKISSKNKRVRLYRFLSELIIDLGLSEYNIKPYELFSITAIMTVVAIMVVCKLILGSVWFVVVMGPIGVAAVLCIMYTKANNAHDQRIEAVLEAENIISNSIRSGVVASVRENIAVLPKQVRPEFEDFLDNIEYKKYHIKTALLELNNRLGSVADEFIKKCITLEVDEQKGTADIFREVIEINNIKMELRRKQKRSMEQVTTEFKIGASMILIFLIGVMIIYKNVRVFYFTTVPGKLIIIADILLFFGEYVFMTVKKAKEL